MSTIAPPGADEYAPFYAGYVSRVGDADPLELLLAQPAELDRLFRGVGEGKLAPYAEGKWSVREVLVHLADSERIFSTRALRLARGDRTPLPGFDENVYAPASRADRRPLEDILAELHAVRASTLALFRSLEPDELARSGTASDAPVSVRALAWIIAGHMQHHLGVLRDRYGLG